MNAKTSVRSVADPAEDIALATVDVAAPPDRVFRALTASEDVVRWWGSDDVYRTTGWVADLRIGGHFRADGLGADGKPFTVEGEFLAVDAPERLAQTWKADWDEGPPTMVAYRLEATEGGTRVTLRHTGFGGRSEACRSYADGWGMVLQWLELHFAPKPTAADLRFFLFCLQPPRPTFSKDMTAEEGAVMQEHFAYWAKLSQEGTAVVYGPVDDPKGAWGLAVVRVTDEAAVHALQASDPAIKSHKGFHYDVSPMAQALVSG